MQQKDLQRTVKLARSFLRPPRSWVALALATAVAAGAWWSWQVRAFSPRPQSIVETPALSQPSGLMVESGSSPEFSRRSRSTGPSVPARLEVVTHTVESGESLWSIAEQYHTDVASILANNNLDANRVVPIGLKLRILTGKGLIHQVQPGDTVSDLARRYSISEGSIILANNLADADALTEGQQLVLPGAEASAPNRVMVASRGESRDSLAQVSGLIWPARGPITSPFGWRWGRLHKGIDIGAP